jgi:hypothetical protein
VSHPRAGQTGDGSDTEASRHVGGLSHRGKEVEETVVGPQPPPAEPARGAESPSSAAPSLLPFAFGTERRRHPRISAPFPTQVLVTDANGARCTLEARLHNLSAGGLYLRLAQRLEPGTLVYVVVQYAHPPEGALVHLAMQGVVRRVQPETYGQSGVAVQFTQHQFL